MKRGDRVILTDEAIKWVDLKHAPTVKSRVITGTVVRVLHPEGHPKKPYCIVVLRDEHRMPESWAYHFWRPTRGKLVRTCGRS